jgi:hypothetical protein
MTEPERRIVRFDQLNLLGKAVFLSGAAVRVTANLIDAALDRAAGVVVEAERAFLEEFDPDPNIEDAKIIEEYERSGA